MAEETKVVQFTDAEQAKIKEAVGEKGWETLMNRGSTTWRNLPEVIRENVTEDTALALMAENPTLIKRPVIEIDNGLIVGFKPAQQRELEEAI